MTNVVELKGINKTLHGHEILQDIDLAVREGEFLTLLGPSGCGKTTLLNLISGFSQPTQGRVLIDNHDVTDLAPNQRPVHTVFQSYALFPHMSVYDNVAFGLRCQRIRESEISERVHQVISMVKLDKYLDRKPDNLSGGQQQRVAIARAAVNKPRVLLLDEPLSSLDYRLRQTMQIELKQLQRKLNITFIFVTHDQEEALSMSDRIVVMQDGRIQQIGTPRQVYEQPKNLNVAKFIGEATIFQSEIKEIKPDKKAVVTILGKDLQISPTMPVSTGQAVHILLRPEDVRVWHTLEAKETDQMYSGTVEEFIYKGRTVDLIVRLQDGSTIASTEFFDEDDEKLEYKLGEKVWISWMAGWEVILPHEG